MVGHIGEFIYKDEINEWVDLESLIVWYGDEESFSDEHVSCIYNNSAATFKYLAVENPSDDIFGSIVTQGSSIVYKPKDGIKLYIQGDNFNISISEMK